MSEWRLLANCYTAEPPQHQFRYPDGDGINGVLSLKDAVRTTALQGMPPGKQQGGKRYLNPCKTSNCMYLPVNHTL